MHGNDSTMTPAHTTRALPLALAAAMAILPPRPPRAGALRLRHRPLRRKLLKA